MRIFENTIVCHYCCKVPVLKAGSEVYPHRPDLANKQFWCCDACNAFVGCHAKGAWFYRNGVKVVSDGTIPLGRLANAQLRREKSYAHAAFDPLWRNGGMSRREAYVWLAKKLGLKFDDCHIGNFDVQQCRDVVRHCEALAFA